MDKFKKPLDQYLQKLGDKHVQIPFDEGKFKEVAGRLLDIPDTAGYIYDYRSEQVKHHFGFDKVFGYEPSMLVDIGFITSDFIHPDDQASVQYLTMMAVKYGLELSKPLPHPFETLFTIIYRAKLNSGLYTPVLRRSCIYDIDSDGNPVSTISIVHPLDFLPDQLTRVRCKVIGPKHVSEDFESFLRRARKMIPNEIISNREAEVLHYLAMGMPSSEIAEKLFLSKHTVNNHRKNMLRKTGLKNTAELVRFGLENGLL